jgi:hypothetical protein
MGDSICDLTIRAEIFEESREYNNFSAALAECAGVRLIFHHDNLPVEFMEMARLRLGSPWLSVLAAPGDAEDDSVAAADAEATLSGADDLVGDETDADTVRVERAEDLRGQLLLVLGELGVAKLALGARRQEDKVGAIGAGHHLEASVAESDQRGDGDDRHRRSDLPRVVVPPEDQRGCRARRRSAVLSRAPRPRQSADGRFTALADIGSWG